MDLATFRDKFPEFAAEPPSDESVQAALTAADEQTSDYFGDVGSVRREEVIALRAAQALALQPYGRDARLSAPNGSTVYDSRLAELVVVNGLRVRSFG